jgi:hypothetical protein
MDKQHGEISIAPPHEEKKKLSLRFRWLLSKPAFPD